MVTCNLTTWVKTSEFTACNSWKVVFIVPLLMVKRNVGDQQLSLVFHVRFLQHFKHPMSRISSTSRTYTVYVLFAEHVHVYKFMEATKMCLLRTQWGVLVNLYDQLDTYHHSYNFHIMSIYKYLQGGPATSYK